MSSAAPAPTNPHSPSPPPPSSSPLPSTPSRSSSSSSSTPNNNNNNKNNNGLARFEWTEPVFGCHESHIDTDHKKLFDIYNEVFDMAVGASLDNIELLQETISDKLDQLYDYTIFHFNREQDIMNKSKTYDPKIKEIHFGQHKQFRERLSKEIRTFVSVRQSNDSASIKKWIEDFLKYFNLWFTNHILRFDRMIMHTGPFPIDLYQRIKVISESDDNAETEGGRSGPQGGDSDTPATVSKEVLHHYPPHRR